MPEPERDPVPGPGVFSALFAELRRRRVLQVAGFYLAMGGGAIQVVSAVLDNFEAPPALKRWFTWLVVLGFPIAVLSSWAYDLRVRRERLDGRPERLDLRVRLLFAASILAGMVLLGVIGTFALRWSAADSAPPRGDAATPLPVVAVLPVRTLPREAGGALAMALETGLTNALVESQGVTVRAQDVVAPRSELPFDSLAAALALDYLVRGTLDRTGPGLELTIKLERAGTLLSGGTFTSADTTLAAAEQVTRQAASYVLARVGAQVRDSSWRFGTTSNDAFRSLYAADKLLREVQPLIENPGNRAALRVLDAIDVHLAESMRADPEWTEPILMRGRLAAHRALALRIRGAPDAQVQRSLAAGIELANELLRRDPRSARALWMRGLCRHRATVYGEPDSAHTAQLLAGAERDLKAALVTDPGLAAAAAELSDLLFHRGGDFEEARFWAEQAYELDAYQLDATNILHRLALATFEIGNDSAALALCQRALERFATDPKHQACVLEILAFGASPPDPQEAWRRLEGMRKLSPPGSAAMLSFYEAEVAAVLARAGLADSALHVLERARASHAAQAPTDDNMLWLEAAVRFRLEQTDTATKLLRAYVARRGRDLKFQLSRRALRAYLPLLYRDRPAA